MKKIIIDKTEGIAEVIDRILNEPDSDITLVVPKGSALGKSVRNFHLLKREADSANRNITIESVDDTILAFAKESDVDASHPLWRGVRGVGGISDIVPKEDVVREERREERAEEEEVEEQSRPTARRGAKRAAPMIMAKEESEEEMMEEEEEKERAEERVDVYGDDDDDAPSGRRVSRKVIWSIVIILAAIFFGVLGVTLIFNHADIAINFKRTPWQYTNNFVADKSATQVNAAGNVIPAQIFTSNKNTTQSFHASAVANVSTKAKGTITIYNAYNSSPQDLVATTRFLTPDGKLFRLVGNVTVPGAQVTNGKITPSSIDAPIIADQAGPNYNVGPVAHLSIPGFQGTPRADAFYGVITGSTSGGATGQRAVPTAADITAAKASTTAALQANLSSGLTTSYPNNFKILDGATTVQLTKVTVNTSTDNNGNFTVYAEGLVQAIGFDEAALKNYLLTLAQSQESNSTFSDVTINYSSVSPNFTKGQVSFGLAAQGSLEPAFSADNFKQTILGKSISDARQAILSLPQLADGKISVWPLWLWTIPSNPSKVHITSN